VMRQRHADLVLSVFVCQRQSVVFVGNQRIQKRVILRAGFVIYVYLFET
jgi:hypothetical protein